LWLEKTTGPVLGLTSFKHLYEVVYFSNVSGNTHRFVEKLNKASHRIPIKWDPDKPMLITKNSVLFVPTYGGGNFDSTVPKQVVKFLNIKENREKIKAVIGFGNTNFGDHFCRAGEIVAEKLGVPLLYRVEIMGTPYDVEQVNERLEELWTNTVITN